MIWHIFKKDVRLLWPMALAVVATAALCAVRTTMLGFFDQPPVLDRLTGFLPYLVYLGIAIVAVTVVHQEPLSGPEEDWLTRPIRRRDLALSKVLFVLLMVNVPLLLIDVAQQVALHFPLSVSVEVAFYRFLVVVFVFSLPGLVLGVVTRSLIDAFVFGIATAIGFMFLVLFATAVLSPAVFGFGNQAGMVWISVSATGLVIIIGAATTLAFQYSARHTWLARGIGLAVVLIALCTFVALPKTVALGIQESLWGSSNSGGIKLRFDPAYQYVPSAVEGTRAYGNGAIVPAAVVAARAAEMARIGKQMGSIRLPVSLSGLPVGDILIADRAAVRIVSLSGKVLYEGAGACTRGGSGVGSSCMDNTLHMLAGATEGSDTPSEQRLYLPISLYERIKNDSVRVEIMYALTRLVPRPSQAIAAIGGRQSLPEMGSCATRMDDDADEVQLGCLTNVDVPFCTNVVLEDPQTNKRNPEFHLCRPNYGPVHREGFEDAVSHSSLSIPFRDPSGLARYPVDSAAIERARIVLTVYDPIAHFRTTVAIPNIRLGDWQLPSGSGS
jgi:hypothetical protein